MDLCLARCRADAERELSPELLPNRQERASAGRVPGGGAVAGKPDKSAAFHPAEVHGGRPNQGVVRS